MTFLIIIATLVAIAYIFGKDKAQFLIIAGAVVSVGGALLIGGIALVVFLIFHFWNEVQSIFGLILGIFVIALVSILYESLFKHSKKDLKKENEETYVSKIEKKIQRKDDQLTTSQIIIGVAAIVALLIFVLR